jgi:hypothetical protein
MSDQQISGIGAGALGHPWRGAYGMRAVVPALLAASNARSSRWPARSGARRGCRRRFPTREHMALRGDAGRSGGRSGLYPCRTGYTPSG